MLFSTNPTLFRFKGIQYYENLWSEPLILCRKIEKQNPLIHQLSAGNCGAFHGEAAGRSGTQRYGPCITRKRFQY